MNKQMKQHLTAVVTSIVNEDPAAAKEAFREYVSLKTKAILLGEESKDDKKVDADLDDIEKKAKKAKKDQKKDVKDEEAECEDDEDDEDEDKDDKE